MTFFCGWLVIHSNRIKARRNSYIWCYKHELSNQKAKNGIHDGATPDCSNDTTVMKIKEKGKIKSIIRLIMSKILNGYKFLILNTYGKCIVGALFVFYISMSAWSASNIREGINIGDLVSDNSYFKEYIYENLDLFDASPAVMLTIYEPIDYTKKTNRLKIEKLIYDAQSIENIDKDFTLNWMKYFEFQLKQLRKTKNMNAFANDVSNDLSLFSNDIIIKFNKSLNRSEISASRFYVKYGPVNFTSQDAKPMYKLQELCKNSGLPVMPYAITFKYYEQFDQTLPNILQTFLIASEAMYLVSLIFIPDLVSTICIVGTMISIMVGLVGFMHLWGLTLSSISMIELIMSVGFCIDFSAHVTHAFLISKGSRNERAFNACVLTGFPILNSAVSSIIGVSVLAFSKSYIFRSFFKTMTIVMVLGVLTSMFFLPVLLSLVGPHWKRHQIENNEALNENKLENTNKKDVKKALINDQ